VSDEALNSTPTPTPNQNAVTFGVYPSN